ncbi:MAG: hypothetical protein Q8N63_02935 [Nanoarchaeota archaeon]|nr:hypothetical protein [Nanoarchaeota archaeon]
MQQEDTKTRQETEGIIMAEHKKIKKSLVGTLLSGLGTIASSVVYINTDSDNIKYIATAGFVASGLAIIYNLRNYSKSIGPFFNNLTKLKYSRL